MEQKYTALINKAQQDALPSIPQLQLCFQILSLGAAIDTDCTSRLSCHQLSEGKFVLLFLLHDQEDGLSPCELAERAGVTRATVTGLLDGLERSELAVRSRDKRDRRSITVRLSPKGKELIGGLFAVHTRWISTLFAGLIEEERTILGRLLHQVWLNTDAGKASEKRGAENAADGEED